MWSKWFSSHSSFSSFYLHFHICKFRDVNKPKQFWHFSICDWFDEERWIDFIVYLWILKHEWIQDLCLCVSSLLLRMLIVVLLDAKQYKTSNSIRKEVQTLALPFQHTTWKIRKKKFTMSNSADSEAEAINCPSKEKLTDLTLVLTVDVKMITLMIEWCDAESVPSRPTWLREHRHLLLQSIWL